MGVTLTGILEIQDVYRRLMKTSWEMSIQPRESDGTIKVDLRPLDRKDGKETFQTLDCLLLFLLLLQVSPTRE